MNTTRKLWTLVATAAFCCLNGMNALAWDHPGHMASAAIAFDEIERARPDLIEKIGALMLKHPDPAPFWVAVGEARGKELARRMFIQASRWPGSSSRASWRISSTSRQRSASTDALRTRGLADLPQDPQLRGGPVALGRDLRHLEDARRITGSTGEELAGAAAVSPTLAPAPIILAVVLFLWTPPHFWSSSNSSGTAHASRLISASQSCGRTRGTLSTRPPPVTWTSARRRASATSGRSAVR